MKVLQKVTQWIKVLQSNQKDPGGNPLGARPGVGNESRYEAPTDLRVEIRIKMHRLTLV